MGQSIKRQVCEGMKKTQQGTQSAQRMLALATRWKMGIYQSIRRAKLESMKMTIPLWKIWDNDRTDGPKRK